MFFIKYLTGKSNPFPPRGKKRLRSCRLPRTIQSPCSFGPRDIRAPSRLYNRQRTLRSTSGRDKIPFSVRDGDILKLENNTYQLDEAEKEKRKKRIQEKLNKLKQISNN